MAQSPAEECQKCLKQCNVYNVHSESDGDKDAMKQKVSQVAKWA